MDGVCLDLLVRAHALSCRRWVSQQMNRFGATGRNVLRRNEWSSSQCPRCQSGEEDTVHVWLCPHAEAQALRQQGIDRLRAHLAEEKTAPDLTDIILHHLSQWLHLPDLPTPPIHRSLRDLVRKQDAAGWQLPFTGFWYEDWCSAQQQFYDLTGSGKTGRRWLASVIRLLWDIAYSLWEHRNKMLHDHKSRNHQLTLVARIRAIYRRPRNLFPPPLRRQFVRLRSLLAKPVVYQEAWLAAFETYDQLPAHRMTAPLRSRRVLLRTIRSLRS